MKLFTPILIALIAYPLTGLQAQEQTPDSTLSRTVVVEQEYTPYIRDAQKINAVPEVLPPAASHKEVEYDAALSPTDEMPSIPMPVYNGVEAKHQAHPGYLRIGYGNRGNLDARARYLLQMGKRNRIGIDFRMKGTNGTRDLPGSDAQWDARYYRTYAALDYTHQFRQMDFDVAGHFGLSNFNYLPQSTFNRQRFTSGDVHVGVSSTDEEMRVQFEAETNLLFYNRKHDRSVDGLHETIVRTAAHVYGNLNDRQTIGITANMDNVFYDAGTFDDYTSLDLNPYFSYKDDRWNVRIGMHLDWSFGWGGVLSVSPDISAQLTFADSYVLYAQTTGGNMPDGLRFIEYACPYALLDHQLQGTYEQLNAAIGLKGSPIDGLWFHLYGGYQDLADDVYALPNMSIDSHYRPFLLWLEDDTQNAYAGATLSYDYKDIVKFSATGTYRHWKANDNDELGIDYALLFKPMFEGDIHMDLHPINKLHVHAGYRHIIRPKTDAHPRMDAVSNLYLKGSYNVYKGLSVYLNADNLMNKEYQYYWGYPAQGISILGGISWQF